MTELGVWTGNSNNTTEEAYHQEVCTYIYIFLET